MGLGLPAATARPTPGIALHCETIRRVFPREETGKVLHRPRPRHIIFRSAECPKLLAWEPVQGFKVRYVALDQGDWWSPPALGVAQAGLDASVILSANETVWSAYGDFR